MKNFAKLKDSIYTEVLNCMTEDRSRAKQIIKGYVAILKQYPVLKEVLDIHNNLETGYFRNDDVKHGFIIENLNAIKKINKEELRLGLESLDNFIKGNQINYSTDTSILSEKISDLMLNVNKVSKSVENNQNIEYIIENVESRELPETKLNPITHQIFKDVATKNYNDKYGNLTEAQKQIVKSFFNLDKNTIKEQYQTLIKQITESIVKTIQASDDKDTKIKLYEVKDRLSDIPADITLEHFNKLLQLQESLVK